jgi:molybdopterin converting factor small subunit
MKINLIAYGIAREILSGSEVAIDIDEGTSIESLKTTLLEKYPDFAKLQYLKLAVNEDYQEDDYVIHSHDDIVIIPPVSGG